MEIKGGCLCGAVRYTTEANPTSANGVPLPGLPEIHRQCLCRAGSSTQGGGDYRGQIQDFHARQHGPSAGHPSLAKLAQGTVCKILAEQEVKPHKVRYYLEQRDPEFEPKMAEILCVYRQVAMLRSEAAKGQDSGGGLVIVSYDEKPGI